MLVVTREKSARKNNPQCPRRKAPSMKKTKRNGDARKASGKESGDKERTIWCRQNKPPSPPLGPAPFPFPPSSTSTSIRKRSIPWTCTEVSQHGMHRSRPLKPRAQARPGDPFRGQTTGNSSTGREEGAVMMFAGEVDRRGERESSGEGGGAERPKEWPRS